MDHPFVRLSIFLQVNAGAMQYNKHLLSLLFILSIPPLLSGFDNTITHERHYSETCKKLFP